MHDQGEARTNHLVKLADGRTSEVDHVLPALLQLGTFGETRSLCVTEISGYDVILGKP